MCATIFVLRRVILVTIPLPFLVLERIRAIFELEGGQEGEKLQRK